MKIIFIILVVLQSIAWSDRLPDIYKALAASHKIVMEDAIKDYVKTVRYADKENTHRVIIIVQKEGVMTDELKDKLEAAIISQKEVAALFHKDPSSDLTNLMLQVAEMAQKTINNKRLLMEVPSSFSSKLALDRLGPNNETVIVIDEKTNQKQMIELFKGLGLLA